MDGQADGLTDDGQQQIRKAYLNLRISKAKNYCLFKNMEKCHFYRIIKRLKYCINKIKTTRPHFYDKMRK